MQLKTTVMVASHAKPSLLFFRKYLPALKKYPAKYIYEPWKAPLTVQQAAGCLIGKDYPKPIVDHTKVVKVNLAKMKDAREKQYGGSSEQGLYFTPILSSFIYFERVLVEQSYNGISLLSVKIQTSGQVDQIYQTPALLQEIFLQDL